MALDRSSAYIFCKICIISPVLKQKWPKKKDLKMHKKRNFSKMGFLENFGLGYYKEPKGEHWVDSIGKKPFLTKKGPKPGKC